jgi:sugar phosphate isomerase/epimerase
MSGSCLRYGYVTSGLAHHRLDEALRLLADLGYDGCAITLDHAHLDPFAPGLATEVGRIAGLAQRLGLALGVETGARFLLDPRRKHEPTLLSAEPDGRARRVDFLGRAIAIARDLGAPVVSLWSGIAPRGAPPAIAWARLREGVEAVVRRAGDSGVRLGFEPEPGMLAESVADYRALRAAIDDPALGLTLDLGHCLLTEPAPPAEVVRQVAPVLVNVHAEDMRRPLHEHLAFGQGEMCYPPILAALAGVAYTGLVNVELSRDSHRAPEVAAAARAYLADAEREAGLAGQPAASAASGRGATGAARRPGRPRCPVKPLPA